MTSAEKHAARRHLLPFGGASLKGAFDPPAEPADPGVARALAWQRSRQARIDAARAARPVPTAALLGSRYSGGFVAPTRSAR